MNFARLNHILIPSTKEERDRFRETRVAQWLAQPLARAWLSLTDEGRGLLGISLIAGLIGLDVSRGQAYLVWAVAVSLVVASIAARPLLRLKGVRMQVEGPPRVGVGADAHFRVRLRNSSELTHSALRVGRPFLPWDGTWTRPLEGIAELAPGGEATVEATARFVERGHHHLDPFSAAALLPLGLVTGPALQGRGTRFVVVPQVAKVDRIDLAQGLRVQPGGVALASVTGESMEVAGLRDWRGGDRIRDLHARSWARAGKPVVREYQEEYFSRVAVLLDCDVASLSEEVFEAAVSLTAGIVQRLLCGEALIDLETTADNTCGLTLGRSLASFDEALDALAEVQVGTKFDGEAVFAKLRNRLDKLSGLAIVTGRWDAPRADLVLRCRQAGVGVRVIRVGQAPSDVPSTSGSVVRVVSEREIAAACTPGTGLSL